VRLLEFRLVLSSAWHFIAALSNVASAERNFYAQKSYAERGADNRAKWSGVPYLSIFDVALLGPLLPALAILISWWLPWELWRRQEPSGPARR
jgi:hypothetical protein